MDIRVAAYGVIIEQSRILLAHWNEKGHSGWTLPGGGLEEGEDPEAAALREITEETGFRAELDELLGIDSRVLPGAHRLDGSGRPLHTLRIIYRAHVVDGQLRNELDGSTDMAEWVDLDQVHALRTVSLVSAALKLDGRGSLVRG